MSERRWVEAGEEVGVLRVRIVGLTAVEVTVAAAGGAFQGPRITVVGGGGRHKLAATVESVAADGGGVVLQALFVGRRRRLRRRSHRRRRVWVVALDGAVGGLNGWSLSDSGGGGGGSVVGGKVHVCLQGCNRKRD